MQGRMRGQWHASRPGTPAWEEVLQHCSAAWQLLQSHMQKMSWPAGQAYELN